MIKCKRTQDVFDTSGRYLKSICMPAKNLDYSGSKVNCESKAMHLLVIDSDEVLSAIYGLAQPVIGITIWINGRRDNSGWFSNNPQKLPIFPGLSWAPVRSTAKCLSITRGDGKFEAIANDCEKPFIFFCEYQKSE